MSALVRTLVFWVFGTLAILIIDVICRRKRNG